ncbi:MAG: NfeD family protein, partial [Isosphaeraceae bacterium]
DADGRLASKLNHGNGLGKSPNLGRSLHRSRTRAPGMNSTAWPLLFVTLGFILLVAEVFIPSGGVLGVVSLGLIVWGVWLAFQGSFVMGAGFLLGVMVLAPIAIGLAFHVWPKTPMGRRLILSPPRPEDSEEAHEGPRLDLLVGLNATAITPLRPSGRVDCEGRSYDSLAESGLIDAGAKVVIVGYRSGELVVRESSPPASTSPPISAFPNLERSA